MHSLKERKKEGKKEARKKGKNSYAREVNVLDSKKHFGIENASKRSLNVFSPGPSPYPLLRCKDKAQALLAQQPSAVVDLRHSALDAPPAGVESIVARDRNS